MAEYIAPRLGEAIAAKEQDTEGVRQCKGYGAQELMGKNCVQRAEKNMLRDRERIWRHGDGKVGIKVLG